MAIQATKEILATDYNAEAKLYAVRVPGMGNSS